MPKLPTLLLLTLLLPSLAWSHHVIFENIGQMAGALSYIHCKLTLNISSILHQHQAYYQALIQYRTRIADSYPDWNQNRWHYQDRMKDWLWNAHQTHVKIIELHMNETVYINEALLSMKAILPQPTSAPSGRLSREQPNTEIIPTLKAKFLILPVPSTRDATVTKKEEKEETKWEPPSLPDMVKGMTRLHDFRAPRFLGFLAPAFGAFGTFMGLYNLGQINKLQTELQDVNVRHNRLVEVVEDHDHHLNVINKTIDGLTEGLNILAIHDPALASTRLSYIETQIKERIQTAVHTIQQAQHRRLAIDFLSHIQIQRLYARLQQQAEENECTLLTQQQSDLFQL